MNTIWDYSVQGNAKEAFDLIWKYNTNPSNPIQVRLEDIFFDTTIQVRGLFSMPSLIALKYFCGVGITMHCAPTYRSDSESSANNGIRGPIDFATCSLCKVAESITKDPDIPDRDSQGGVNSPLIPMSGVEVSATVTIPPNVIFELPIEAAEVFTNERNQFGWAIIPEEFCGEAFMAKKIFDAAVMKAEKGKLSMFLKQTDLTYSWFEEHYFKYASGKDHSRKFILASVSDTRGILPFFGITADEMTDIMNKIKSNPIDSVSRGYGRPKTTVRAVVTTPIHDMFNFMMLGKGTFRIVNVRQMTKWVNNPIDVSTNVVAKYGVRLAEPVAVIKRAISKAFTEKPELIPEAIDDCFNGHMIDYVLEFDMLPDTRASDFNLPFTSGATMVAFGNFLDTVRGVLNALSN